MDLTAIFSEDRDECLEHYGVKGMKWGKHKDPRDNRDTVDRILGGPYKSRWSLNYRGGDRVAKKVVSIVKSTLRNKQKFTNKALGKSRVSAVLAKAKTVTTAKKDAKEGVSSTRVHKSTGGGKF